MPKISTHIKLQDGNFWSSEEIMSEEETLMYITDNISKISKDYHIVISNATISDLVNKSNNLEIHQ